MRIVVLLKQVPKNFEFVLKTDHTLDRERTLKVMNPADKCALLQAVELSKTQGGDVVALTMGPRHAVEILSEAVALGADRAILLEDRIFAGSDTFATAHILSRAIEKLEPDLVLCGRRAIDGETGQVGPELAVMLGMNCLSNVVNVSCSNHFLTAKRMLEDRYELVSLPLPAVLSVLENPNAVVLPSVLGLRKAKRTPVECWNSKDLGLSAEECGLPGSKTRVIKTYQSQSGLRKVRFVTDAKEGADIIRKKLGGVGR